MTAFEKLDRFLRNLYETAFYFAVMAVKENLRNYVGRAGTVGSPRRSSATGPRSDANFRGCWKAAPCATVTSWR